MHYVAGGLGAPVVLLHGWPGFSLDYRHVIRRASAFGHTVAPDLLGFGQSDPVRESGPDAADEGHFARDVLDLMDRLQLARALLVGYDIGSAVAPAVVRLAPERVAGLVLLNPTHPLIGAQRFAPDAQREAWYQHFHRLPIAVQLIDGDRAQVRAYLAHFYEHWSGRVKIDADTFAEVVEAYARPGAFAASIAWYRSRAHPRFASAVTAIQTPTIALWGDRDPMRPIEHREGFERTYPNSRSRVLPGVGHFVPAEAPAAVVAAIRELLS